MSKEEREKHIEACLSKTKYSLSCRTEATIHSAAGWEVMDDLQEIIGANKTLVNLTDSIGYAPLHYAARYNRTEATKFLLKNGAETNAVGYYDWTPLHLAKNAQITKMLIDSGANVNAKTLDNRTPITQASLEQAKLLIAAGAETDMCFHGSSITSNKNVNNSCPGGEQTLSQFNKDIAELLVGISEEQDVF